MRPPATRLRRSMPGAKSVTMSELTYPYSSPPGPGEVIEVAQGVLWARLALPFRLNHVNIYFIRDNEGWLVLDTGIATEQSRAEWEALLGGPLKNERLTRLIVTHSHPDHIGLAGWLARRFGMEILTSQTTWLTCLYASLSPGALNTPPYREIYRRHGLDEATTDIVVNQGHRYLTMVAELPPTFRRIVAGDVVDIGRRSFEVMTGDGHAAEQVMLYCQSDGLFFAADQVLAKISPNVSTWAVDPDGNPLGHYLTSLRSLRATVREDVLVLPGHQLPFHGLHRAMRGPGGASRRKVLYHRAGLCKRAAHGRRPRTLCFSARARSAPTWLRIFRGPRPCQLSGRTGQATSHQGR